MYGMLLLKYVWIIMSNGHNISNALKFCQVIYIYIHRLNILCNDRKYKCTSKVITEVPVNNHI